MDQTIHSAGIREPGQSSKLIMVDRPSEFDAKFEEFVTSMGVFKIVGISFKMDEPPDGGWGKSKSARAARRRRNRKLLRQLEKGGTMAFHQENMAAAASKLGSSDNGFGNYKQEDQAIAEEELIQQQCDEVYEENEEENNNTEEDENCEQNEEEGICEAVRKKSYEYGKTALISLSTIGGVTLLIRLCYFLTFPEQLKRFLEGKEYLKVGYAIQNIKSHMHEKHGVFVLNFVDPRRPLFAWKQFTNSFQFDRFGLYSVGSHLFDCDMQNIDQAACLASKWTAPELNCYLKRAASRETQLTIDAFAEMCIQMRGGRQSLYSLSGQCYDDSTFFKEIMEIARPHINSPFDMKHFNAEVFNTPAMQQRYRSKLTGLRKPTPVTATSPSMLVSDEVPDTFADRVLLRRSKSTVQDFWTTKTLYAGFDISLFNGSRDTPVTLTKQIGDKVWRMTVKVNWKGGDRLTNSAFCNPSHLLPAVNYHKRRERLTEMRNGRNGNLTENQNGHFSGTRNGHLDMYVREGFDFDTEPRNKKFDFPIPSEGWATQTAISNGVKNYFEQRPKFTFPLGARGVMEQLQQATASTTTVGHVSIDQFSTNATLGSTHEDLSFGCGFGGVAFSPVPETETDPWQDKKPEFGSDYNYGSGRSNNGCAIGSDMDSELGRDKGRGVRRDMVEVPPMLGKGRGRGVHVEGESYRVWKGRGAGFYSSASTNVSPKNETITIRYVNSKGRGYVPQNVNNDFERN